MRRRGNAARSRADSGHVWLGVAAQRGRVWAGVVAQGGRVWPGVAAQRGRVPVSGGAG